MKEARMLKPGSAGNTRMSMLKMSSVADLPKESVLIACVRAAVDLNERGVKIPKAPRTMKKLLIPMFLREALKRAPKAQAIFQGLSQSHKREYVEWLMEAKREETRQRRLATAITWLAEGKPRNWKYMK
jgi:uncharacterized protein YdeI (YjbR/CyaY-like superfamily)